VTLTEPRERAYIRTLERSTKQKIEIAAAPTAADLHCHRLNLSCTLIQEILLAGCSAPQFSETGANQGVGTRPGSEDDGS
jgi:hypothetical protein